MTDYFRQLDKKDVAREIKQKKNRTSFETLAYRWLPDIMKKSAERNPAIAFAGHATYYPDLFFRKEKFLVEIDGAYHNSRKQKEIDEHRDKVFLDNGFHTIRIQNEDTLLNVSFWQKLVRGLESICLYDKESITVTYIEELHQMIENEIRTLAFRPSDDVVCYLEMNNLFHRNK